MRFSDVIVTRGRTMKLEERARYMYDHFSGRFLTGALVGTEMVAGYILGKEVGERCGFPNAGAVIGFALGVAAAYKTHRAINRRYATPHEQPDPVRSDTHGGALMIGGVGAAMVEEAVYLMYFQ